jgi:hypothetical protein
MHAPTSWDNRDILTPPDDPLEDMTEAEVEEAYRQAKSEINRWAMRPIAIDQKPIVTSLVEILVALAAAQRGIEKELERRGAA